MLQFKIALPVAARQLASLSVDIFQERFKPEIPFADDDSKNAARAAFPSSRAGLIAQFAGL
jgi:hypothetical protein